MALKNFSGTSVVVVGVLALVLLVSVPMGHALEIHHLFAKADHDGHQHSDFDLCQWVQSHTANSLLAEEPTLGASRSWLGLLPAFPHYAVSSLLPFLFDSRGPPPFLLI